MKVFFFHYSSAVILPGEPKNEANAVSFVVVKHG